QRVMALARTICYAQFKIHSVERCGLAEDLVPHYYADAIAIFFNVIELSDFGRFFQIRRYDRGPTRSRESVDNFGGEPKEVAIAIADKQQPAVDISAGIHGLDVDALNQSKNHGELTQHFPDEPRLLLQSTHPSHPGQSEPLPWLA